MTTHPRNFPSIDPAKLEKLAETAVKVGLNLQPGRIFSSPRRSPRCRWRGGSRPRLTRRARAS